MDIALGRREVASILFKHAKRLAVIFFAVFVVFFGGSYILTDTYKAETRILVQSGREFEVATQRGDQTPTGVPQITKQEIINSEVEILGSRDLAESVIRSVGIKRMYPGLAEDGVLVQLHIRDPPTEAERMNAATKKFTKKLKIESVTMSNIITLSYWNADRDVAIEALAKLAQVYQQRHAEIFGNKGSGVLGQQTGEYEKQLVDVTHKITDLKNAQHLSDIAYEREQLIQDRSDVESKLRDLKTQSIEAHRSLEFYQQQLKSMPELVLTNQNSADAIETAKSRLLDLNTQLLTLKQRYASGNPDAVGPTQDLENQIAQIKTFINDPTVNQQNAFARNITYDDGRLKLQNAAAAAPAVDQKIAFETAEDNKILARLQALDDGEASLEVMTREQGTLRELVHDYRDRYEEARIAGNMDKENLISVSIVHAPESDVKPDKPNHLLFAAVGIVAGMLAVGLAIFYFLVFRESIITTESLERTLNLRVLGAVPDIA
jgi:polysaccharide biosynthesis transport protein